MLVSFLTNGASFLAFAIVAAKRRLTTVAQGIKSIYFAAGLAEGAESVAVFCAMCLWPAAFQWLAGSFALLCFISAAGRLLMRWRTFA